jgi:hypothetical protein
MSCQHFNFQAYVNVCRLTADTDPDKVVGFAADVKINCVDCGMPFEFTGLPSGVSVTNSKPMVSIDGTELRAPIKPSSDAVEQVKSILNTNA